LLGKVSHKSKQINSDYIQQPPKIHRLLFNIIKLIGFSPSNFGLSLKNQQIMAGNKMAQQEKYD